MTTKKAIFFFSLPVLVSLLLHLWVLKLDLIGYHVWRQTQTQTVIYNFTFSDHSIFHPQKFDLTNGTTSLLYEFPLYQWLIAQANNALGYSVLHTRLLSFLFFAALLLGFYRLLRCFVNREVALISNTLLCFSPLLYYYCVNPLPDTLALCFAVWALFCFFQFITSKREALFICFCLLILLATLIKLPYLMFGIVLLPYLYRAFRGHRYTALTKRILFFGAGMIPALAWYFKAIPTWDKNPVAMGMLANDKPVLQLLDYFWFHLISSTPELLTNYAACIFLVSGIYWFFKQHKYTEAVQLYFISLFAITVLYFLLEINMIEKVHDYYLMPFLPLLFLVSAYGVKMLYEKKKKVLVLFFTCLVPITAWLRINTRWDLSSPGFTEDYLTQQAKLQSIIPQDQKCIINYDDSHFICLYYLKRQGYSLFENELNEQALKDRYLKGAHYFVTEDLSLDLAQFPGFNFEELYSKNLKVYKLSLK